MPEQWANDQIKCDTSAIIFGESWLWQIDFDTSEIDLPMKAKIVWEMRSDSKTHANEENYSKIRNSEVIFF